MYEEQGKCEEAEKLYKKAMAIREEVLGEKHPETVASYNNMAGLYKDQGKYKEAEELYKKALVISEEILGEAHPYTRTQLGVILMSEKIIAICAANFYTETSRDMINSISRECEKKGFSVWIFNAFSELNFEEINDKAKESVFDLMEKTSFSAVVILTPTIQNTGTIERIRKKALALQIPVISYEMELEGCYNILFDYEKAFMGIIEHLIEEHGCRRINMIAGRENNDFSQQRIDIYKKVLKKHGISVKDNQIGYGDFWDEPAMKVMQAFIDQSETLPDAVFCANDAMAMAACRVLERNGYSVPKDII